MEQMLPRTNLNAGSLTSISLEAGRLTSVQRQTVLAHLAAADTHPDITSNYDTSSTSRSIQVRNRMPSSPTPRPDPSPNVEAILNTISTLNNAEARALHTSVVRTMTIRQR